MMPLKLVTFDVTGTLLFFRTPILEKYLEIGLKFGVNADMNVLKKNFKHSWNTLNVEHPNFGKETGLGWQKWWEYFVERTFMGILKPEEKSKVTAITEDLISFHTTEEAFTKRPGTDELLEYLNTKSVQIGVISNYDPRLTQILDFMELKKYLNFTLTSYEFGYSKPDRRIFQEALKLGACDSGNDAIHVGDDLELDYLGAKEAGLRSILISSDDKILENSKITKEEVFQDFFQLKTHFQNLWK